MNIGILGGTFDPVHLGHLILAETAAETLGLERVLFVPAGVPPHRPPAEASAEDRYRMVRLAVSGNLKFSASDFEIKRPGPSYTYETVRSFLKESGGQVKIHLILGADAFQEIGTWYKINELISLVTFAVAGREQVGYPPDLTERVRFQELKMDPVFISGQALRKRIKEGRSIRYLVPDPVREYIIEHGLYR